MADSNSKKRSSDTIDPKQDIAGTSASATKKPATESKEAKWSLGTVRNGERFAYVDQFKGSTLISFREFYTTPDGELKPGSKGISLSLEQFKVLKEHWNELCEAVEASAKK